MTGDKQMEVLNVGRSTAEAERNSWDVVSILASCSAENDGTAQIMTGRGSKQQTHQS